MTDYDPPTIRNHTWYPEAGQKLAGRLIGVRGVAYDFAPETPLPVLNLAVPATTDGFLAAPGEDGTYERIEATVFVEVHCFPARLLREIQAVRPKDGELVEITTGKLVHDGFLDYSVSAGGRYSTLEHWGPQEVEATCPFGAQPFPADAETPGERTAVFHPVSIADVAAEEAVAGLETANAGNPLFVPSPKPRP